MSKGSPDNVIINITKKRVYITIDDDELISCPQPFIGSNEVKLRWYTLTVTSDVVMFTLKTKHTYIRANKIGSYSTHAVPENELTWLMSEVKKCFVIMAYTLTIFCACFMIYCILVDTNDRTRLKKEQKTTNGVSIPEYTTIGVSIPEYTTIGTKLSKKGHTLMGHKEQICNHRYCLRLNDCKLEVPETNQVLYSGLYHSKCILKLQLDGNLVLYNHLNRPLWSTQTDEQDVSSLVITKTGSLYLMSSDHEPIKQI